MEMIRSAEAGSEPVTLYVIRREFVVVSKVSVSWAPLPSKVSMSWAFGHVPVVCALAGLGSLSTSQDRPNTRPQHATTADIASEATVVCTTGCSLLFDCEYTSAASSAALPATSTRVGPPGRGVARVGGGR